MRSLTLAPTLTEGVVFAHGELTFRGSLTSGTSIMGARLELDGESLPVTVTRGDDLSHEHTVELRVALGERASGRRAGRLVVALSDGGALVDEGEIEIIAFASAAIPEDQREADLTAGRTSMWCEEPWLDGSRNAPLPLTVSGWAWSAKGISEVAVIVDGRRRVSAIHGYPRPELRPMLGDAVAETGGFSVTLDPERECPAGLRHVAVVAIGNDGRSAGVAGSVRCVAAEQMPAAPADDAITADRYVPEHHVGYSFEAEHHARYRWAGRLAPARRVLDAGCGAGYGLSMLSEAGAAIVAGFDVSPVAVKYAREHVASQITVIRGSLEQIPFPDAAFDLVTCFEAIEHVAHPEAAFAELARVLAEAGVLLISTPNRGEYEPGNPHHLHEFSSEEFEDALRQRFAHVEVYRQQTHAGTLIADNEAFEVGTSATPIPAELRKVSGAGRGNELYMVALASRRPLPRMPNFAVLGTALDLGKRVEELQAWRKRALLAEAALMHQRVHPG